MYYLYKLLATQHAIQTMSIRPDGRSVEERIHGATFREDFNETIQHIAISIQYTQIL